MDPAFKSRIHISLWYPRLDKAATIKIWKRHIEKAKLGFKNTGREFEVDKIELLTFAKEHYRELRNTNADTWNGRYKSQFTLLVITAKANATDKSTTPFKLPLHLRTTKLNGAAASLVSAVASSKKSPKRQNSLIATSKRSMVRRTPI